MSILRRPEVFFIVGHPRSGTNWVCNLVNLHPHVACDGEFHFHEILRVVERMSAEEWRGGGREPAKTAMRKGFEDLVQATVRSAAAAKPRARIVGDRTPRHLEALIPGCKHLVCVRDGRDVLVSWTFHMLTNGGPWLTQGPFGDGMKALKDEFDRDKTIFDREPSRLLSVEAWLRHYAKEWAERVRADLVMTERMNDEPALGSALWVGYERLLDGVERERRRMFRYLGVSPARAEPIPPESNIVPGYSRNDPASFFRSGKAGDWKRYFTAAQAATFAEVAAASMDVLPRMTTDH